MQAFKRVLDFTSQYREPSNLILLNVFLIIWATPQDLFASRLLSSDHVEKFN